MDEPDAACAEHLTPPDGHEVWREPVRGGHPGPELAAAAGLEQLRAMLTGTTPNPPLSHLLGMRMTGFGPGTASFTMPLTGWLCRADGSIPLGLLTIPADAAMACAIISELPPGIAITTSELSLRMVRAVEPGAVVHVEASLVEMGPPVALAEVTLTDGAGCLVARGGSLCVALPALSSPPSGAPAPGSPPANGDPDPWERPAPRLPIGAVRAGLEGLRAEIDGAVAAPPLQRLTGLRPVAAGPGRATLALPATRWLCAPPPGRAQGGAVATLADAAVSAAIATVVPEDAGFVPVEIKLNYLRPLMTDGREARAEARLVHAGRRTAVAAADVTDADGRPVAVATGSAVAGGHPA